MAWNYCEITLAVRYSNCTENDLAYARSPATPPNPLYYRISNSAICGPRLQFLRQLQWTPDHTGR